MPQSFLERARSKFIYQAKNTLSDFESELQKQVSPLAAVTDDTALVLKGQLYIEEVCVEILSSFFNSDFAESILINHRFGFGSIIQLLRASNLITQVTYDALEVLRKMRNGLAHKRQTLDEILNHNNQEIKTKFTQSCVAFKIKGIGKSNLSDVFIKWLGKLYMELHMANLVATTMNRFANKTEFIDQLENINLSKVFSDPENLFSQP
jgi:uncharacterized protein YutE (UPF0331/DUF86 family)